MTRQIIMKFHDTKDRKSLTSNQRNEKLLLRNDN